MAFIPVVYLATFLVQFIKFSIGASPEFDGYVATINLAKGKGTHSFVGDIKAVVSVTAGELSSTAAIQVETGQTIALKCQLEAYGTWFLTDDTRQEWVVDNEDYRQETVARNRKKLVDNPRIRVKVNRDKYEWTLTIKNVQTSDSGSWNCLIWPDSFGTSTEARANLKVLDSISSQSSQNSGLVCNVTHDEGDVITKDAMPCEPITVDNMELCPDLTYDIISMPNIFGHKTQSEATEALAAILKTKSEDDCPIRELACSTHLPPCKYFSSGKGFLLPCRSVCETAKESCHKSVPWPVMEGLDCDRFPDDIEPYSRCWEPSNDLGQANSCQYVPSYFCRELGFRYTRMKEGNPFNHKTVDEALTAFMDEDIQKLISSGCSEELASFVCASYFPPCEEGEVIKPCSEVCRRNWKSCKNAAETLGVAKPDLFSCSKRFLPASNTESLSFADPIGKCLLHLQPPNAPLKIQDIRRLRTSIEFNIRCDDNNVDAFTATTYKLETEESLLHPPPPSQSMNPTVKLTVNFHCYGYVIIGDPDDEAAIPLDPDASYFIVVQAMNRFGLGPMTVVALPRYKNDQKQRKSFSSSKTPGKVNWLEESGDQLTFFRLSHVTNQFVCVNLNGDNDNLPRWGTENCTVAEQESMTSTDVTRTVRLSDTMTLLIIGIDDMNGHYTCSVDGSTAVVTVARSECVESHHFLCGPYGGTHTVLPTPLGHRDLQDAELSSYAFLPLLHHGCDNTTALEIFICSAYAPGVDQCDSDNDTIVPCREVCLNAFKSCESSIEQIGFEWPSIASCDNLPSMSDGNVCNSYGVTGFFENRTTNDSSVSGNETTGNSNDTSCMKPRRYDPTDLGMRWYFRGWADVQGLGAANDYCRVVKTDGHQYLSCALAGTAGESEYNYNSPNASIDWFDPGHMDTWYMKDEDDDGKDDYCRCVGEIPNTFVSCMKSGESGFIGHYDFTPQDQREETCHYIKVNPFLGPG